MTGYLGNHRDITDRHRAEEALRAANRRTEAILERISDTFFVVDDQWRYTYVNDRAVGTAREAWGREVSAEELLGKNCWELFPEHLGTPFDRELHRAVREQRAVEFETYSVPTGTWVEVRAYPSRDGLSVYSRDVTARRHGREALAYHASLLDNVEDGVIATDADDFRITGWNKGAERVYGFTAEEVLGRPAREVASYPGDEARRKLEHELLESGRTRIEFTAHRKDGTPIEVELIAAEVRNDRAELTGYLGIHRDITERKQAEEALREAKRRSETILESIGDDFLAMDREWRITYMNQRALADSRKTRGEQLALDDLLGRSYWEAFPETVGTAIDREFHRAARDQAIVGFELVGPLSAVWFDVCAYPTDNGLSVYSRDITERKDAERRVVEAREAERGRIARTLHDEALQSLTDAIAIATTADRTTAESRLAGQMLPALRRVGEQLRSAIYDLRLATEEHRPFVELLERLVEEHRAMVEWEIKLEIGDGIPSGSLGLEGIEVLRILGEALTNARRHAEARHVRVRVWGTKDGLRAEVSDDGRGIDPASLASPMHHGITGMRERAEPLNGRLEIDSEPGAGTTVRLEAQLANETKGHT